MFTSSQKNTAFRSINAYENRYEMQICILRPEKARFSHPVIARNRCREHAQHAPLMKGRSSGSGIIIVSRLPGFPVAYLIRLLRYSGGTARDSHPFPYYPAAPCRLSAGTSSSPRAFSPGNYCFHSNSRRFRCQAFPFLLLFTFSPKFYHLYTVILSFCG